MSNSASKRRTIFIDKAFQGRFILYVLLLILLSGVCSAVLIYWITGGDLQAQSHTAHTNITTTLQHLVWSIFLGNVIALLIAGGLSVFFVLYSSHKIAGPLYRFEKLCEHIGDNQLDTITTLREHDQLQELGTAFARMVDKLRSRQAHRHLELTKLASYIEQLQQDADMAGRFSDQLEQMQIAIQHLRE